MMPRAMRWALATIAICAAAACGDRELTQPSVAAADQPTLDVQDVTDVVAILKRTQPLDRSVSASKVIGPEGGHIQLGQGGLRIDFAPGAVRVPTRITVTAAQGTDVAYNFEPHGTAFSAPVTITQSLRGTTAWKNPTLASQLEGSYFDRLFVDRSHTWARRMEKRPARLQDRGRLLEFNIEHFSGYMISTGKAAPGVQIEVEVEIR